MGEANEGRSSGMEHDHHLSLQMDDKYPRDLLQRFMASSTNINTQQSNEEEEDEEEEEREEASEEIELNLGLSLGGRFGIDKNAKNKLIRSSSVASSIPMSRDDDVLASLRRPVSYNQTLIRTSSLPTETEEEWRKRKELQTQRRMEAKRRRIEKQRNFSKTEKEFEFEMREKQQYIIAGVNNRLGGGGGGGSPVVAPPFGFSSWAAAARQAVLGGGGIEVGVKGKGSSSLLGLQGFGQPNSQGSVESQGGSSSGMSEFESKPLQGSSSGGEARSPVNNHSLQERINQEATGSSGTKANENTQSTSGAVENSSKKPDFTEKRRESGMNAMEDMPCVFTRGEGPNGRRIDGILYRYGKGEEVRIMCVCHGSFLSPAEFVKHAGGGNVAHPLKHIVVNPSSTSFL